MRKFLAVLLPIILVGSLASSILVSATPCDPAIWRPAYGWTGAGQHIGPNQTTTPAAHFVGSEGNSGWFELRPITHNWNEDGTVLLSSVRHQRRMVGGVVNLRLQTHPGGRALGTEYNNVIAQVPVMRDGEVNYVFATGEFFMAGTSPCWGFWVVVDAVDIFGVNQRGVMHSSMVLFPDTGAEWFPGPDAVLIITWPGF